MLYGHKSTSLRGFRADDEKPAPWYDQKQVMIRRRANAALFWELLDVMGHIASEDPDQSLRRLAAIEAQMCYETLRTPAPKKQKKGRFGKRSTLRVPILPVLGVSHGSRRGVSLPQPEDIVAVSIPTVGL